MVVEILPQDQKDRTDTATSTPCASRTRTNCVPQDQTKFFDPSFCLAQDGDVDGFNNTNNNKSNNNENNYKSYKKEEEEEKKDDSGSRSGVESLICCENDYNSYKDDDEKEVKKEDSLSFSSVESLLCHETLEDDCWWGLKDRDWNDNHDNEKDGDDDHDDKQHEQDSVSDYDHNLQGEDEEEDENEKVERTKPTQQRQYYAKKKLVFADAGNKNKKFTHQTTTAIISPATTVTDANRNTEKRYNKLNGKIRYRIEQVFRGTKRCCAASAPLPPPPFYSLTPVATTNAVTATSATDVPTTNARKVKDVQKLLTLASFACDELQQQQSNGSRQPTYFLPSQEFLQQNLHRSRRSYNKNYYANNKGGKSSSVFYLHAVADATDTETSTGIDTHTDRRQASTPETSKSFQRESTTNNNAGKKDQVESRSNSNKKRNLDSLYVAAVRPSFSSGSTSKRSRRSRSTIKLAVSAVAARMKSDIMLFEENKQAQRQETEKEQVEKPIVKELLQQKQQQPNGTYPRSAPEPLNSNEVKMKGSGGSKRKTKEKRKIQRALVSPLLPKINETKKQNYELRENDVVCDFSSSFLSSSSFSLGKTLSATASTATERNMAHDYPGNQRFFKELLDRDNNNNSISSRLVEDFCSMSTHAERYRMALLIVDLYTRLTNGNFVQNNRYYHHNYQNVGGKSTCAKGRTSFFVPITRQEAAWWVLRQLAAKKFEMELIDADAGTAPDNRGDKANPGVDALANDDFTETAWKQLPHREQQKVRVMASLNSGDTDLALSLIEIPPFWEDENEEEEEEEVVNSWPRDITPSDHAREANPSISLAKTNTASSVATSNPKVDALPSPLASFPVKHRNSRRTAAQSQTTLLLNQTADDSFSSSSSSLFSSPSSSWDLTNDEAIVLDSIPIIFGGSDNHGRNPTITDWASV